MPRRPGMQMVSTVILWSHAARSRGVAQGGVKIDDPVESPRSSNPLVYRHALCLTGCGPGTNALIRKNSRAENLEAPGVRPSDDLFVSRDDFIRCHLGPAATRIGIRCRSVWLTNVVGAFEQNHRLNPGLRQNVASQPGQRVLSPAGRTGQHAVAADARIQHCNLSVTAWQAPGEHVRPALILIRPGRCAIGNRVTT